MADYMLRELCMKDCEYILEWMHDPQINCWYTDPIRNATKKSVEQFITDAEKLRKTGKTYHYAIVNRKDEYIGTISLKNIEKVKGAEYAISMRRCYQGKGIASWATKEIFKIAFYELELDRVYLNVLSDNFHANQFYIKNKFRYEGESLKCIQIGGELKSLRWYALLKEEFEKYISILEG